MDKWFTFKAELEELERLIDPPAILYKDGTMEIMPMNHRAIDRLVKKVLNG